MEKTRVIFGLALAITATLGLAVSANTNAADAAPAAAEPGASAPAATLSSVKIEEPPVHLTSADDQLLTFAFGPFSPESVLIDNGNYQFDYGSHPSSFQAQVFWALKLIDLAGGIYFEGGMGFSALSGNAVQGGDANLATTSYTLGLLNFDFRLMYAGDWFPWKPLVPFVQGGYRLTAYYQPGTSGLESAEGTVGNPTAGGGLRLWLNRRASLTGATPWYLTARVDRVFPSSNTLNLSSISFVGGVTLGL